MAQIRDRGNGHYQIRVSMGYDTKGKKLERTATFTVDPKKTPKQQQKELQAFAIQFEEKIKNGLYLDAATTKLSDFAERWMKEYVEPNLQPSTTMKYKQILDDLIIPQLGHMKLQALRPHIITSFYNGLTKDGSRKDGKQGGYSSGSIHKVHTVLSSILQTAVRWEVIERNPCATVKIPSANSEMSVRKITIPESMTEQLAHLKESQDSLREAMENPEWNNKGYLFTQENGSMMNYSTPYEALQDIINRYNQDKEPDEKLPMIAFHGLRHTNATLLIAAQQDIKTVSARLEHSQSSTTMNIYAHALEEREARAADAIEDILSKTESNRE